MGSHRGSFGPQKSNETFTVQQCAFSQYISSFFKHEFSLLALRRRRRYLMMIMIMQNIVILFQTPVDNWPDAVVTAFSLIRINSLNSD